MTQTTERAAFLAERAGSLGGSDIASVYSLDYGCRLRLWREKTGQVADYPDQDSGPMKLGRWLEPHIAEEYERVTGRRVHEESQLTHPDEPCLKVHIDRTIVSDHRPDAGVLEIKAFGRGMFAKMKREGMGEGYLLQLQHGMLVTGRQWGAYAAMNRDSGDLLHWDVARDEAVCNSILIDGPIFWSQVENGPAPEMLDPDDPRCQTCCYRRSCQGAALALVQRDDGEIPRDDSLLPILREFDERRAMFQEAEALLEESKEVFRTALGDRQAVEIAGRKVYHRPQTSMRVDAKLFNTAYPDLVRRVKALMERAQAAGVDLDSLGHVLATYGDFKRASVSQPLRIF